MLAEDLRRAASQRVSSIVQHDNPVAYFERLAETPPHRFHLLEQVFTVAT
jgi:hypothetical protein